MLGRGQCPVTPSRLVFWRTFESSTAIAPPRPQVLLAEDNVVNRTVAVRMLEKLGAMVDVVADNGSMALQTALHTSY